jgi:hypothetical protein
MNRMADLTRERLTALRNGLLRWHKSLLDAERAAYERDVARIANAGQYLQLVLADPWFAWLREVSQFIVIVDETLAQKEPATRADADRLLNQARDLLVPAENGSDFARRYDEAMQRDPAAVLAHGELMMVFAELAKV